jgi:hypothetical protein
MDLPDRESGVLQDHRQESELGIIKLVHVIHEGFLQQIRLVTIDAVLAPDLPARVDQVR